MLKTKTVASAFARAFSHSNTLAAAKSASPATYKLTYFDVKALGESIRLQFALANVKYENERIPREKWAEYKSKLGWGQLPILTINGNTEIVQSSAIGRYLAHEFGQIPQDRLQQARCDEVVSLLQDVFIEWRLWVRQAAPWVPNKDPRRVYEVQKHVIENVFPFYFSKFDGFIKQHGSKGCIVGDKITWADLVLANLVDVWTSKHGTGIIEKFPRVVEQHANVFNQPSIKAWVSKRPDTWS